MKKRFKMSKRHSKGVFTRNAVRTNRRNLPAVNFSMRGGIRL